MRIQFTMTSAEGKRMIAKGISSLKEVKKALRSAKIFLKGGTTVSAVSEELIGKPMRISGRITPLFFYGLIYLLMKKSLDYIGVSSISIKVDEGLIRILKKM